MQDYGNDYYQGDLGGFDPRTEAYRRGTSRFNEMSAGDAPTDEALERLSRRTADIAHGFNDLLTTINGNCSLALRVLAMDHPSRMFLLEIQTAGERATGFAHQLLAYDAGSGMAHRLGEKSSTQG